VRKEFIASIIMFQKIEIYVIIATPIDVMIHPPTSMANISVVDTEATMRGLKCGFFSEPNIREQEYLTVHCCLFLARHLRKQDPFTGWWCRRLEGFAELTRTYTRGRVQQYGDGRDGISRP
jgi:hypothetical protein